MGLLGHEIMMGKYLDLIQINFDETVGELEWECVVPQAGPKHSTLATVTGMGKKSQKVGVAEVQE